MAEVEVIVEIAGIRDALFKIESGAASEVPVDVAEGIGEVSILKANGADSEGRVNIIIEA